MYSVDAKPRAGTLSDGSSCHVYRKSFRFVLTGIEIYDFVKKFDNAAELTTGSESPRRYSNEMICFCSAPVQPFCIELDGAGQKLGALRCWHKESIDILVASVFPPCCKKIANRETWGSLDQALLLLSIHFYGNLVLVMVLLNPPWKIQLWIGWVHAGEVWCTLGATEQY